VELKLIDAFDGVYPSLPLKCLVEPEGIETWFHLPGVCLSLIEVLSRTRVELNLIDAFDGSVPVFAIEVLSRTRSGIETAKVASTVVTGKR
jgi:hypothetical protein